MMQVESTAEDLKATCGPYKNFEHKKLKGFIFIEKPILILSEQTFNKYPDRKEYMKHEIETLKEIGDAIGCQHGTIVDKKTLEKVTTALEKNNRKYDLYLKKYEEISFAIIKTNNTIIQFPIPKEAARSLPSKIILKISNLFARRYL
ncbi:MAG: hypothetical protein B6U72_04180 [Candidatus Altiarchaeales archaeon ex4484_2]|nr:MAG: hypothetical protein B6U72_04180 [Candidatus Altiarchaeales archaeon ex4484_2]